MSANAAIIARLGLDAGDFRKEIAKAQRLLEQTHKQIATEAKRAAEAQEAAQARTAASIKGVGMEVAGIAGIPLSLGAAASAAIAATNAVIDFASGLQDTSDAIGIDVVSLQELQHAFSQTGSDADTTGRGLSKLSQSIDDARKGNEKTIATFESLGVTWAELNKLTPDQILMRIAASAESATDPSARLAAIVDLLGRSGLKMAAGLNAGAGELANLRAEANTLTADQVAALDNAGDKLNLLQTQTKVFFAQLITGSGEAWGAFTKDAANAMAAAMGNPAALARMLADKVNPPAELPDVKIPDARNNPLADPMPEGPVPEDPRAKAAREAAEKEAQKSTAQRHAMEYQAQEDEKEWREQMAADSKAFDEEKKKQAAERLREAKELADFEDKWDKEVRDAAEKRRKEAHEQELKDIEQTAKLERDLAAADAKAREKQIDDKVADLADPNGKRDRDRAKRKEDSLRRRAERELDLEERKGKSKTDVAEEKRRKEAAEKKDREREQRGQEVKEAVRDRQDKTLDSKGVTAGVDASKMAADIGRLADNFGKAL